MYQTSSLFRNPPFGKLLTKFYWKHTLQQTNTNFTNLGNGSRSFTVNGVYQAISQGDEKITFEANHTITMQDNAEFTSPNQYFDYFN